MKIIEIITHRDYIDSIKAVGKQHGAIDQWIVSSPEGEKRQVIRLLVDDPHRQAVMDGLQNSLSIDASARIVILPVEATLPKADIDDKNREKSSTGGATREELYHSVSKNTELNSNFLLLVFLSVLVQT